ncbi:MAG: iron ABC transporter permease [Defluviitaleaceae bacterium]|nr:iron ABC transporter permease [Defluviitaleaceae bacterium]
MKHKIIISAAIALVILLLAVAIGSIFVHPWEIVRIILHRTLGLGCVEDISNANNAIIWNLRLPRVLLAFLVGAMLSVSGAIMQSVLRNPLASSFTLGVSSGASLGAALVLFTGLAFLPMMTLPVAGFAMGMATMVFAITLASRIDGMMENNTIILMGMVISMFINAVTTLLMALNREGVQRLIFWQLGSFSMQNWMPVVLLAPILLVGILVTLRYNRELDIMTFGEDNARTMGVNLRLVKWALLLIAAGLTGSAIAFVGIIGFIDLVAPHTVRRLFGSRHIVVIPLSAIFGGSLMVVADLVARTITPPNELPVGVVTALIGAPFFAYIYFVGRRRANA